MGDPTELWTAQQVADHAGVAVSHVYRLHAGGNMPAPVGRGSGPGRALLWEPETVHAWLRARHDPSLWTLTEAARQLGVTVDWLAWEKSMGRLPVPAVRVWGGARARWDAEVLRVWLAGREKPDTALDRSQVLELIGRQDIPRSAPLPVPDGKTGQRVWWRRDTIEQWWQTHLAQSNRGRPWWARTGIERHTRRTWAQLSALPGWDKFPQPIPGTGSRPRWDRAEVTAWWQHELEALGERWDSQDVAQYTGLTWNTIRTYRKRGGVLPDPDGTDGFHPWWRPDTIRRWNDQRRKRG